MKKLLMAGVSAIAMTAVYADTLYMTASDASGKSSFTTWNVSGGGTDAPSSANNYVDEGFNIRAPNVYDTKFPGNSLTLGSYAKDKNGVIVGYNRNTQKMTFENAGLVLEQGRLTSWSSGKEYTYAGTITVKSPIGAPFIVEIADAANHLGNTNIITATVKGEADTELAIANNVENPLGYAILNPSTSTSFAGTLTLGECDYGRNKRKYPVRVEYRGGRIWPGTIHVKSGSEFLSQYGSTKWTIGSLALDANSTMLTKIAGSDTSTITLTNSLATAYPVKLTFPSARTSTSSTASSTVWSVLTLPTDKGDLGDNLVDFVLASQPSLFPDSLPAVYLRVSTNEAQTVASLDLVQRQIVRLEEHNALTGWSATGYQTAITNAASWSDGVVPHGDADYVIDTKDRHLCLPPQELRSAGNVYEFPGSSLTLGAGGVNLYSSAATTRIPVLRMVDDARYWPSCFGGRAGDEIVLEGDAIHLLATGSGQSYFRIYGGRLYRVNAPLTGDGRLTVFNNSSSGGIKNGTILFAADSSAFTGRIRLSAAANSPANTLLVTDASQLGGPLDTFTYDALDLKMGSTLAATNDVALNVANRGVFIDGSGVVDVAEGATLAFGNSVSFSDGATLAKTGAGTLAFGDEPLNRGETAGVVSVEEGFLKVLSTNALDGISVSFADGAYLLVDPAATGDVATFGAVDLSATPFGETLPVAFALPALENDETYDYSGVVVCTVADEATAKGLTLSAKRVRRHSVNFSVRANANGTATVLADVKTRGLVLSIR